MSYYRAMGDSGLRAALQETMAGLMATDQVGLMCSGGRPSRRDLKHPRIYSV